MPLLYDIAMGLYHAGIRAAAPWKPKAKQWATGRADMWQRLEAKRDLLRGCLWMHCASVGEFEQGRPVLEAIKRERPDLPVLLTFFSPSGYEARKDFPLATHVEYLPPDSAVNARRLLDIVQPRAAIFVKYEFWYHHLHALKARGVPTFLVSAIFRAGQPFFKWYGGAWRSMLGCYAHIFTQDEASRALLGSVGVKNATVSGDTRFDRVAAIAGANEELPVAKAFRHPSDAADGGERPIVVCGSTWPADEVLLLTALAALKQTRVIIAPHELGAAQLDEIAARFPKPLVLWSELERAVAINDAPLPGITTCLVDRIGLLARLYKYGDVAYVGGGFGDGIHSLLEAAAWGKPVIFGPKHTKFAEAKGLIDCGGGFEVRDAQALSDVLTRLLVDPAVLAKASEEARRYVSERVGATDLVSAQVLGVLR